MLIPRPEAWSVVLFEQYGKDMLLEPNLDLLSKRGLETNSSLVYSCAVDEPIDRFVLPRAPVSGDEDNVVYTGRVHISQERLESCYVVSPSGRGTRTRVSLARKHIV
jgi:hypothetical protein